MPSIAEKRIGTDKLGLYGMRTSFDELIATGIKQRATPEKISDLLQAELADDEFEHPLLMSLAKFPVDKDLDHFVFAESPVNETRSEHFMKAVSWKAAISFWSVALAAAKPIWPSPLPGKP